MKKGKGKTNYICTLSNISCPASDTCFVGELTFGCCGADLVVFSGPAQSCISVSVQSCICALLQDCICSLLLISIFSPGE